MGFCWLFVDGLLVECLGTFNKWWVEGRILNW